jgi:hypothetical protein
MFDGNPTISKVAHTGKPILLVQSLAFYKLQQIVDSSTKVVLYCIHRNFQEICALSLHGYSGDWNPFRQFLMLVGRFGVQPFFRFFVFSFFLLSVKW